MKWRNSKERELLASGGSREQTLPTRNNPHPDLTDVITAREDALVTSAQTNRDPDRSAVTSAQTNRDPDRSAVTSAQTNLDPDRSAVTSAQTNLDPDRSAVTSAQTSLDPDRSAVTSARTSLDPDRSAAAAGRSDVELLLKWHKPRGDSFPGTSGTRHVVDE